MHVEAAKGRNLSARRPKLAGVDGGSTEAARYTLTQKRRVMRQRVRSRFEGSPKRGHSDGFSEDLEWVTESPAFTTPTGHPCTAAPASVPASAALPQVHPSGLGWLASLAWGVSEIFQHQHDGTVPAPEREPPRVFNTFSHWSELERETRPSRNGLPASAALNIPSEGAVYFPNSRSRILGATKVSTNSSSRRRLRADDERASRSYASMLKAGVPRSAVRHRMRGDGCSAATVQFVAGGEEPASCLECTGRERVPSINFSGMLDSRVPLSCICHQMIDGGVPASGTQGVVSTQPHHYFAPRRPSRTPKISDSDLIEADERAIRTFQGMVNAGIPTKVVKEKMISDGLSSAAIVEVTQVPLTKTEEEKAVRLAFLCKNNLRVYYDTTLFYGFVVRFRLRTGKLQVFLVTWIFKEHSWPSSTLILCLALIE